MNGLKHHPVSYMAIPGIRIRPRKIDDGIKFMSKIEETAYKYFDLQIGLLQVKSAKRERVFARQIVILMARKHTNLTLSVIGHYYRMDHTTVCHCLQTINDLSDGDSCVRLAIHEIETQIKEIK